MLDVLELVRERGRERGVVERPRVARSYDDAGAERSVSRDRVLGIVGDDDTAGQRSQLGPCSHDRENPGASCIGGW